jgi:hypothetical protein
VARRFADQREEIVPFLYAVIDDKRLYAEKSLGRGYAPPHAISLLGQWQVVEAVPRLITILEESHVLDIVSDRAAGALKQMPPEAIEPVLAFGQKEEHAMDAMFILASIGKGDDRCFDFIADVLEQQTAEIDIISTAESLALNNVDRAETVFQKITQKGRFRRYRDDFEKIIEEVRAGLWG